MKKAAKVLGVYLLALLVCSLIFSWLGFKNVFSNYGGGIGGLELNIMTIPTIIGGIIALKLTVPLRSFKLFLVIYTILWCIRIILTYVGNQLGEVFIFGKPYHFDIIISNYYQTVSRLQTPLPFIIYWFINYLFTTIIKQQPEKKDPENV